MGCQAARPRHSRNRPLRESPRARKSSSADRMTIVGISFHTTHVDAAWQRLRMRRRRKPAAMLPKPRMNVRLSIASYVRSTMGPASGRVRVAQSLTLHLGLFHQRHPFRRVGVDEARELVGRIARRRLVARLATSRWRSSPSSRPRCTAELSFPMIAGDVPLGATNPFHPITENPASPDCAIAGRPGTSGRGGERRDADAAHRAAARSARRRSRRSRTSSRPSRPRRR